ncbi:hypothetical protein BCR34DRAFT_599716 [Clohesyomyces aquaticus]|uniref:Uncharacterized protein n=1 Tax=Clohesyomyces aquaticus TaxID=1231657 RepID=A0A1Y1ZU15_9PLEO|nr:hypothetical protein BCR34DRAFT_599716 [Clohesyomyces aquaticus]
MHSSPELEVDNDEMFPDEAAGPSTPRNPPALSLDPPGPSELSPPNSQGPSQLANRDDILAAALGRSPSTSLNANGKRVRTSVLASTTSASETTTVDTETGYTWTKQEEQPGWDWKNTRAREDEARAWEHIVDKGSMIKTKYGDPLDPSVPMKRR